MPNYDVPCPAPFLSRSDRPPKSWPLWRDHFVNVFLVAASGDGDHISPRVAKALISCFGEEGQRILSTLSPVVKTDQETEFDMVLRQLNDFFWRKKTMSSWRNSLLGRGGSNKGNRQQNM